MKLQQILNLDEISEIRNLDTKEDTELTGIYYDSREVEPGSIFFAISGFKTDGHDYIDKAIESGASVIVCENLPEKLKDDIVYLKVDDSRYFLGKTSRIFYDNPSSKMVTIGVTGTNGKTSTTSLARDIFNHAGLLCGMSGTIHNKIGYETVSNKERTTPESRDLQALLNEMVINNCKAATVECSSHALYLNRLNGTDFDYAIFTNFSQDHLDFHETMENYFKAKSKLFSLSTKLNIINIDEDWGQRLYKTLKETSDIPTVSYGLNEEADYRIENLNSTLKGSTFTIVTPNEEFEVFLPLIGKEMAANALAATIPALEEGIDIQTITEALASPSVIEGRLDLLDTDADFDIIIDYAHSPDSLEKLLKTVRNVHDGKLVLVFGANGDRDKSKRKIMGQVAGQNADQIVITSDNPASEEPEKIIEMVEEGVKEYTSSYEKVVKRPDGIFRGAQLCDSGDVLVLAGKGHERQEILKDETLYYDEWDTAREAVEKLKNH